MLLKPGQELQVKWRNAEGVVLETMRRLKLIPTANGGRDVPCYVTFVDVAGVSVYLVRGFPLGGDLEAFLPTSDTRWPAYFEALSSTNASYIGKRHFTKIFPREFL